MPRFHSSRRRPRSRTAAAARALQAEAVSLEDAPAGPIAHEHLGLDFLHPQRAKAVSQHAAHRLRAVAPAVVQLANPQADLAAHVILVRADVDRANGLLSHALDDRKEVALAPQRCLAALCQALLELLE